MTSSFRIQRGWSSQATEVNLELIGKVRGSTTLGRQWRMFGITSQAHQKNGEAFLLLMVTVILSVGIQWEATAAWLCLCTIQITSFLLSVRHLGPRKRTMVVAVR
jgi:hypothetical protein